MKKPTKKINIFFNIAENSGVGYYRQFLIAQELKNQGLANVLINDFTWGENRIFCSSFVPGCTFFVMGTDNEKLFSGIEQHLKEKHQRTLTNEEKQVLSQKVYNMVEPTAETLNRIGLWADIMIFGRKDTPDYLSMWAGMREYYNIPIVMDTDDNVRATRPFNPGWMGYHPGSESLHWNKKTSQEVDAMTVSTDNLKHVYENDNKQIFVIPNNLELNRWKLPKSKHHEIRIGLLLSSSHHEDARLLTNVLPVILERYPQVRFYYTHIFGYVWKDFFEKYRAQMIPVDWINLKTWPQDVVNLSLDIGLAPLVDNFFNRAKSNLRFLEYSGAKIATVASPVEPYMCIQHKKTGFLAKTEQDWIDYISILVEKQKLRETMQQRAFDWVTENFDISKNIKIYLNIYKQIINNFRTARGKPKFNRQSTFPVSAVSNLTQVEPKHAQVRIGKNG